MRSFFNRLPRLVPLALAGVVLGALTLTGCDSADSTAGSGSVQVGFATASSTSSSSARAKATGDSLVVTGSNGDVLTIDDVRLIVSGFELEGDDDDGDDGDDNGDDNGDEEDEYEAGPSFLDLPLDDANVAVAGQDEIPSGSYTSFEFEVEDVDFEDGDDDSDEEQRQLEDLLEEIRTEYADWPAGASMVVIGSFTPEGGTRQSFTTYFDAEISVERELSPALKVTANGPVRELTVRLDPARWFTRSDGSVRNLAADNYADTGQLVEFEAEFENGVTEIETDDDDDDDDDD